MPQRDSVLLLLLLFNPFVLRLLVGLFCFILFVCLLLVFLFAALFCVAFLINSYLVFEGQSFIGTNCPSVTVRVKVTSQSYDNSSGMHPKGSQAQISRPLVNSAL